MSGKTETRKDKRHMETIKSILSRGTPLSKLQPPKRSTAAAPNAEQRRTDNGADPNCFVCGGLGVFSINVPTNDRRFGLLFPCECTAAYRASLLQRISGLTGDELAQRLDDVRPAGPGTARMLDAARSFLEVPSGMLTLWGGVGNAKTLILQATVNECIQLGVMAVYITMTDLLDHVRDAYSEKDAGEYGSASRRLDRFATVPVLAIDELDKVKATDWALERETALIDKRYRLGMSRMAGTLLAMNKDPHTLPEWIRDRLFDGRNTVIHNVDPSMRGMMR